MDIVLPAPRRWPRYVLALAASLLLAVALYQLASPALPTVSLQEHPLIEVQQGDIQLYSEALGELFASQQLLLTAPAAGVVTEVLQRPGAQVDADTAIARLENPELNLQVQAADSELKKMQAELRAFAARQQSDVLEQQGRLAELHSMQEQAALELDLITALRQRGVAADVELRRASLKLQQQHQQLAFQQKKFQQFQQLQHAELAQKQEQLKQAEQQFQLLQHQQQKMLVTAGIAGFLQQLDIELGQSVAQGTALARVGSQQQLSARIYINLQQADQVKVGNSVAIDSRRGLIHGHIRQLEAVVANGTVAAEVSLPEQLPTGLRPSLPISANVLLGERQGAIFIQQQAGLRPNSSQRVFVQTSHNLAQAREVTFGALSGQQLLVESGLRAGERFIALAPQAWPDQPLLRIQHQK